MIGEVEEDLDGQIDFNEVRAGPIKPGPPQFSLTFQHFKIPLVRVTSRITPRSDLPRIEVRASLQWFIEQAGPSSQQRL